MENNKLKNRMNSEGFGDFEHLKGIEPEFSEEIVDKKEGVKKSESDTLNKIQKWL